MQVSVVIASFNRGGQLRLLLEDLARQVTGARFELCLVDDGSAPVRAPSLEGLSLPYPVRLVRQMNRGAASARNHGARLATGELLVFLDDDMRVGPNFLSAHLAAHSGRSVVGLGRIIPGERALPLFERWHAYQIEKLAHAFADGEPPRGIHLYTGNVSVRREDFLAVGGFDESLPNAEDCELGLRLEQRGLRFVFLADAVSRHESSHASFASWRARAFRYGRCYRALAQKHPEVRDASPWRLADDSHPALLPLVAASLVAPRIGARLSGPAYLAAALCALLGFEQVAHNGVTAAFSAEFFAGAAESAGSTRSAVDELCDYAQRFGNGPLAKAIARLRRAPEPGQS